MLDDEPVAVETQERNTGEILGAAIDELGLRAPGNRGPITIDDRPSKLANGRLLLLEHTGEIARFRLAERMLLPKRTISVERGDRVRIMLRPTPLPDLRPPLCGLPAIHTKSLNGQFRAEGPGSHGRHGRRGTSLDTP